MTTVLFAGCTGGMGSLLLDRLMAAHTEACRRQRQKHDDVHVANRDVYARRPLNGKPIRHLILVDFFKDEAAKVALKKRCPDTIGCIDVLHWDASDDRHTLSLLESLDRIVPIGGHVVDHVLITTGMGYHGELEQTSAEATSAVLNKLMHVNAIGPSLLLQWCGKHMITGRPAVPPVSSTGAANAIRNKSVATLAPPTILLLSSFSGVIGLPLRAAYCASKFALNGFVESMSAEFPAIRFVVVCPTSVATNFRDNWKAKLKAETTAATVTAVAHPAPEANAAQLTTEACVQGIWAALVQRQRGTSGGVEYVILPGGKTLLAYAASRIPVFDVDQIVRRRAQQASSKL